MGSDCIVITAYLLLWYKVVEIHMYQYIIGRLRKGGGQKLIYFHDYGINFYETLPSLICYPHELMKGNSKKFYLDLTVTLLISTLFLLYFMPFLHMT